MIQVWLKRSRNSRSSIWRAELTTSARRLFRSLYLVELRFVRVSSGASDEQARRIARAAQAALRASVSEFVDKELKRKQDRQSSPGFEPSEACRSVQDAVTQLG